MSLGRDTIISLGSKLPPALGIFGRLRTLLDDADCDLDEIVELLRVDPALTFQIIKLSNSALYGLKSRTQTLDEAVARVGFGEIHQLVGLIVSRQSFQGDLANYGIPAGRLWENAVAVGALAWAWVEWRAWGAGQAHLAPLVCQRSADGVADPPARVGREPKPTPVVRPFPRLPQPDVPLLDEVGERHASVVEAARDAHHQTQIGEDECVASRSGGLFRRRHAV